VGVSVAVVASLLCFLLSFFFATPAHAQDDSDPGVQVELGVMGGAHFFAHNLELGVADDPALPSPKSNGLFGARVALAFNRTLSLEIEGVGVPTGDTIHNFRLFVVGWRAHVLWHIPVRILDGKLRPFLLAGAGALSVVETVGTEYDEIKKDTDFEFHGGVGLKCAITPLIGLRIDGRVLGVPNTTQNGYSADYEIMGGVSFTLGGHRAPPPPPPPPPPPTAPKDSDGDGIPDSADKCPNAAEDKDGFEDEDGCPDPDNDRDGIPDAIDKCPNEAETKNGIDDDDGCPEKDEDGDGILGSNDKCPNEAEDKDGFEDDDGCPDLDNDKDGIPDATDKCPNEPETKNGYQDEDGCPDVVPAAVAKFTGVIKGITFRRGSAVINPSSFLMLKQAVKVLKDYPALRIEISGHTSDDGKRDFNMKLSQQRADSAKAYLVRNGVDGGRITTVGYGPDKPLITGKSKGAQDKNRRIEFRLVGQDEAPAGATPAPAGAPATAAPPLPPKSGDAPAKSPAPKSPKP
jgi:OOP family OmpA-OmpF porin